MTDPTPTNQHVSRRTVLQISSTGALTAGGLLTVPTATAQQGGTGYVRKGQFRGKNNPDEPRFKIVDQLGEETISPGCTGQDTSVTYMAYKIRCPNYPGGGDHHETASHSSHEDDCPGGSGGRRIYLNPDRHVEADLEQLYRFVRVHQCWASEPEEAERTSKAEHENDHEEDDHDHEKKYYRVTFKPTR